MKYANLSAKGRNEHGRGASRRLRHLGEVPAIIYGSNSEAKAVSLDHNTVYYALKQESFHTSILNLDVDGETEKVLLRCDEVQNLPGAVGNSISDCPEIALVRTLPSLRDGSVRRIKPSRQSSSFQTPLQSLSYLPPRLPTA